MKRNTVKLLLLALVMTLTPALQAQKSFTPEVLLSLYRLSTPSLSPDGETFVYSRSLPSVEKNSISSEIMIGNIKKPTANTILFTSAEKANSPVFIDSHHIAYLSSANGKSQIWISDPSGEHKMELSSFDFDVEGFLFSPDMKKVVIIREDKLPSIIKNEHPDLPKATGIILDDMMYKHWDEWVTAIPRAYIADVNAKMEVGTELTPLLGADEWYEVPTRPFGGVEQLAWSVDSKELAYSCRKKVGMAYAVSTNTDIFIYNLDNKTTRNITETNLGYDTDPSYSPDGKYIAWISMERDGYEADLKRLFIMELASGKTFELTNGYEDYVDAYVWAKDSKSIRFMTNRQGLTNLFSIPVAMSGKQTITPITNYEDADVTGFVGDGNVMLFGLQSMKMPTELYCIQPLKKNAKAVRLTNENDAKLKDIPNITVEKRWINTTDGQKMLTWVILPPNFDKNKKYPAILYCQGGPQSTVSQFWSYRWNIRTFASHDFIIVAPNRRGVPGFGRAWNEQISGDYGGQNMKDYLSAIDAVKSEPYVDADHLGAMGASYGGFSVYWLAGHHDNRFKALFAHAGIFNLEAQYLETEEKFFANWDMGGNYWDKSNSIAQKTYENSPHRFVDKWTAPILISHGEKDFRILASQGLMAFDAARLQNIPARMVIYPDENHWILQPQNGVLFYRTFFDWFDRYLKGNN